MVSDPDVPAGPDLPDARSTIHAGDRDIASRDDRVVVRMHGGNVDDVVVREVSMFRLEDMGDHVWICAYLAGTDERVAFAARAVNGHVQIDLTELPDLET